MKRGDVVLVHIPFVGSIGGKVRPALVVQNDGLNQTLRETIIAEITSNTGNASRPHQVFIDITTPAGAATGLLMNSAVRCERLHTIPQSDIQRVIGFVGEPLLSQAANSLKDALEV